MSKQDLINEVAETHGLTKVAARAVVDQVFGSIAAGLKAEGRVAIPDVGVFSVGSRAARTGRNPQTGEEIKIAATNTVKFKASRALKEVVQKPKSKAKAKK